MTIVRLCEEVINQIAAGEVVENPASVVKELIENSLDAEAKKVEIIIEAGGEGLIRVEDDGMGMNRENALLSIERHATSKIRLAKDLQSLQTMGFRGEALAAIAAISRFEIRTSDGQIGTRVAGSGGCVEVVEPCARNRGTTISISSLFYNTPARKKFQKSRAANAAQVSRVIETIALAHPEISFSLILNGETTLNFPSQEKRARIEQILGPFREIVSGEGIWGLLAAPEEAKIQRRSQYVFVNHRPIFSPLISKAVQMGYGTRLASGLYPPFILFLELSPSEVDVNVHPQKKEVRFQEEGKVFRRVENAVIKAFQPLPVSSPSFSFSEPTLLPFSFAETPQPIASSQMLSLAFSQNPLLIIGPFFLLENGDLFLIDLRKAHARVLFETLSEKKGALQTLIWPLEISIEDENLVLELQKMGIESRLIGKKRLAIDALPSQLEASDFPQFLTLWKEGKKMDQMTTRFSHFRKKSYSLEEGMLLWKQLMDCREIHLDPLGSPIWKKIEIADCERLLKGN